MEFAGINRVRQYNLNGYLYFTFFDIYLIEKPKAV